jgi:ABC-type transport system involved in cytochrome c biogenesis permease subunit
MTLTTAAFMLFAAAMAVEAAYLLYISKGSGRADPFSHFVLLGAAGCLLAETAARSVRIDFIALTNTFESLVFFAMSISIILFVYRLRTGREAVPYILFGGTVTCLALLAVASSPLAPAEPKPPIPALRSSWLLLHVSFAFIGEAFFAVAFVASLAYIFSRGKEKKKKLDRLAYITIGVGYPVFTAGALIFGAVWAQTAWGSYWSWDPKETWALITWIVYTFYLHARLVKKWRGTTTAAISVAGFIFTLFTFFGVNFLLSGLHSYG